MNFIVFDTETVSLDKPYCYDLGYTICSVTKENPTPTPIKVGSFLIKEVWNNKPLFSLAFFADNAYFYKYALEKKKMLLRSWKVACKELARDIKNYNIEYMFAYNASFDVNVFNFNCDYYKVANPIENLKVIDIRGHVHRCIAYTPTYKTFCEKYKLYTETGNYSTTAESVGKYLYNNPMFKENHTAVEDAMLEAQILTECLKRGCQLTKEYTVYRTIRREQEYKVKIIATDDILEEEFTASRYKLDKTNNEFTFYLSSIE